MNNLVEYGKRMKFSVLSNGKFKTDEAGEKVIAELFRAEIMQREENAAKERIKNARLPAYKSFDEFDLSFQKAVTKEQLDTLGKLEWIDDAFNLILIGPPGTGKTHIALAIGNKAVNKGYKVFFSTMDGLMHILKTKEISIKSAGRLRTIKKCNLLIIDELGYLPVSKTEANLFFALVGELYENTSVVITSNKGFEGWAEVLGDAVLTTALLDRLTHRCQILQFSDDSYRLAHRKFIFKPAPNG